MSASASLSSGVTSAAVAEVCAHRCSSLPSSRPDGPAYHRRLKRSAPRSAVRLVGMAAALRYCDAFVSGHSYAALEQVVRAVGEDSTRAT